MAILKSISISNGRVYFFRRLLCWLVIKLKPVGQLLDIYSSESKYPFPWTDVEGVYSNLNCEREAENVSLFRAYSRTVGVNIFYDIGCNYTQLAAKVSEFCEQVVSIDANTKVLNLGRDFYKRSNIEYINSAVIPITANKSDFLFSVDANNSGLSHLVKTDTRIPTEEERLQIVPTIKLNELIKDTEDDKAILKIDIEGMESEIIKDALSINFKGIICFESLSKNDRDGLIEIFEDKYVFYYIKYDFSKESGLMFDSFVGLARTFLFNNASLVVYKHKCLSEISFNFVPLIFCVPLAHTDIFEYSLNNMDEEL